MTHIKKAEKLGRILKERGLWLAVAESCSGGLLSSWITDIPGSSEYFKGGIVSYTGYAKKELLGVSSETLEHFGAESAQTARAMADGVRRRLNADISLSITGLAGPSGGTVEKPVGTVFIGWAFKEEVDAQEYIFVGARRQIKEAASMAALELLEGILTKERL